jgi:hypothetical protein
VLQETTPENGSLSHRHCDATALSTPYQLPFIYHIFPRRHIATVTFLPLSFYRHLTTGTTQPALHNRQLTDVSPAVVLKFVVTAVKKTASFGRVAI